MNQLRAIGCQVIEFTKEDLLKDDPPQEPTVPEEEPADEEQVGSRTMSG